MLGEGQLFQVFCDVCLRDGFPDDSTETFRSEHVGDFVEKDGGEEDSLPFWDLLSLLFAETDGSDLLVNYVIVSGQVGLYLFEKIPEVACSHGVESAVGFSDVGVFVTEMSEYVGVGLLALSR